MKKAILLAAAVSMIVLSALVPAYANITGTKWLGTTYSGHDDYYDANVNAYLTGDTAVLAVTVRNAEGFDINITNVHVNFDWEANYTSIQVNATNPELMANNEVRMFFINFQVPDTSTASNLYMHAYNVVAEFSYPNATMVNQTLTGYYSDFGDDFVVYSTSQANSRNLLRIIDGFAVPTGGWRSAKAKVLWQKAQNETSSGQEYYRQGDFQTAEQRFNTALTFINQAWDAEQAYLTVYEELDIQELQASINSMQSMASFFNGLSVMWALFGVAGILFGIGYIVKWLVHARMLPKQAKSSE